MLEKIIIDKELAALIIRKGSEVKSSTFFSPPELFMQLSIFKRDKGFIEPAHYHKKIIRNIDRVEQFLYLLDGKIRVYFYNKKGKFIKSKLVQKGDGLLLVQGSHGLKILKDAKAISIKQGPFMGDVNDKIEIKKEL